MRRPPISNQLLDPHLPFTRAEARAAGLPLSVLLSRAYQKLFFDVYVAAGVRVTPLLRARAALKVSPDGSYVSGLTAAEVWGAWVPAHADTHVSTPRKASRAQRRGIRSRAARADADLREFRGLILSAPEQAFLDLSSTLGLVDLVAVGDSLVRRQRTTRAELVHAGDHWRGAARKAAMRAARLVRPGVDSPMETRLRLLIVLAGLPEPTINLILRADNGATGSSGSTSAIRS